MNVIEQARTAYAPTSAPIRTPRTTEHQLFAKVTAQLRSAVAALPQAYGTLVSALHENRRMWTHLAAEVSDSDNALPEELRARLFYLSEFTNHQTSKILRGEADAEPLIEINTAVMRGLAATGGAR